MIVVSDTTPLISLMKVSKLGLLELLFQEVLIPVSVYTELTTNPSFEDEARLIKDRAANRGRRRWQNDSLDFHASERKRRTLAPDYDYAGFYR